MTPLQTETLRKIADGGVRRANCGTAAFRVRGASPQAVGALVAKGFARYTAMEGPLEITPAGRDALLQEASTPC